MNSGKHRDRNDPDASANFLTGVPWKPMGWVALGVVAVPALLLMFVTVMQAVPVGWVWLVAG